MRTQKSSKKPPAKKPKPKAKKPRVKVPFKTTVSRADLGALQSGARIVIAVPNIGPLDVRFVRVTRAGKGPDVIVDLPAYRSRGARIGIPISEVITIDRRPPTTTQAEATWRKLAEDAIKVYSELVDEISGRDLVEDATFTVEISKPLFALQRRASELAGQQELFQ